MTKPGPLIKLRSALKDVFQKSTFMRTTKRFSEFIYANSEETALMMLVFNAVSVISGHLSQIGGLKKGNRENKDYLITQEKNELGLDVLFTVLPPFAINNYLVKKIDGGDIRVRSTEEKLNKLVASVAGSSKDDLYSTDHLIPVKQQLYSIMERICGNLVKKQKVPRKLETRVEELQSWAKSHLPDPNAKVPSPTILNITTDFDNSRRKLTKDLARQLYHGSAVDEIYAERNGLLILATLAYTAVASNVIMPYLKNKLANIEYARKFKIDPNFIENEKRRKRFGYGEVKQSLPEPVVFNDFFYKYDGDLKIKADDIEKFGDKVQVLKMSRVDNTFSAFARARNSMSV